MDCFVLRFVVLLQLSWPSSTPRPMYSTIGDRSSNTVSARSLSAGSWSGDNMDLSARVSSSAQDMEELE